MPFVALLAHRLPVVFCLACLLASPVHADTPVARYQAYLAAIASSDSLLALTPYMSEDKRTSLAREIDALRQRGSNVTDIELTLLQYMKASTSTPATITPYVIGDEAALVVERVDSVTEVLMLMENGLWVIEVERLTRDLR